MTDYTNERWHVDGATVTHDDFPGMTWGLMSRGNAGLLAAKGTHLAASHATLAWLAAQPKPAIKAGMRIEATLRGGAVVTGEVTEASNQFLYIGYILMFRDFGLPANTHPYDVMSWHEVTS